MTSSSDRARRRQVGERVDPVAGHDLAAGRLELRDERRRRRPAAPPRTIGQPTAWANVREDQPERGTQRAIEAEHRVRRDRRRTAPAPRRRRTGRGARPRAERSAGRPNRASASGCRGTWTTGRRSSRPSFPTSRTSGPNSRRHARPSAPPRPAAVAAHRSLEDDRAAAVERVGERRVRVDRARRPRAARSIVGEERRGERQRQDRRAHVVAEPGERQLGGPRPAAGRRRGLVDTDRAPGTGQGDRRGQAVRARPRRRSRRPGLAAVAAAGRTRHAGCRGLTPGRSACGRARSASGAPTGAWRCCGRCASSATAGCRRCRRSGSRRPAPATPTDDREVAQGRLPELVVLAVAAEHVGELVERVGRPLERLGLGDDHVAVAPGREGDPRRQGMAFGGHERERLVVRVQDQDAGRQLDRGTRARAGSRAGRPRRARSRTAARRTAGPSARTRGSAPSRSR